MNDPRPNVSLNPSLMHGATTARGTSMIANATPLVLSYLRMIFARKWLFLAVFAAIAMPLLIVIATLPPIYRATATVMVESTKARVVSVEEIYGGASANREYFQTQAEFLRSRDVAMRVIRDLNLVDHPEFDPRRSGGLIARAKSLFGSGSAEPTRAELEAMVYDRLQESLEVAPVRLSQLIQVSFESRDPALARAVANGIADAYIKSELDARLRVTQTAVSWLNEQIDRLRSKVESSEQRLQAYRESSGLIGSRTTAESTNTRQLDEFAQRLVQARIARSQLEQTYTQSRPGAPNRFEVPAVFNNPAVMRAREAESAAERKLAELRDRVGQAHPQYVSAQSELDAARRDRIRQSEAVIASIEREYEAAKAAERAIEGQIARARGAVQEIGRKSIELEALEREAAGDKQLYQTFLSRVKETSATADFQSPVGRLVDPAIEPVKPSKPLRASLAGLTLLGAALFAAVIAALRERQQAVLRTTDDVETTLGVPLLTAVPRVEQGKAGGPLALNKGAGPLYVEAVRTGVTGIQLATLDMAHSLIVVTSTVPEEGKSTMATSFAVEQARTRRILLVDADVRRPRISSIFGLPEMAAGLSDLIAGAPLESCIHSVRKFGLDVLPCGKRPENPMDLLANPRFADALRTLRERYDMVIVDTPPVELVSDAMLVAREADGLVYVVKASSTPVRMVQRGLRRLEAAQVPLLGVVLNAHDFAQATRYYGDTAAQTRYHYGPTSA
jgi:capsular exopolysaccharide synthesis family protein